MLEYVNLTQQQVVTWAATNGIKIALILLGIYLIHRFSHFIVEKIIRRTIRAQKFTSPKAEKKREDTLIRVFSVTLNIIIILIGGLMILSELGFNTTPILASAGIAGIALGFGGQYLIKDVISGFFIILENQYRVGDVVCAGDTCGLVEDINLRLTRLRDLDGTVHNIPNGEIKVASNLSKEKANVNLNVRVSYSSDLKKVESVINKTGNELSKDKEWRDKIHTPPQFLRVDNFSDSGVEVKILGETEPLEQWSVTGELRKRLLIAFHGARIEIPVPQRAVHLQRGS